MLVHWASAPRCHTVAGTPCHGDHGIVVPAVPLSGGLPPPSRETVRPNRIERPHTGPAGPGRPGHSSELGSNPDLRESLSPLRLLQPECSTESVDSVVRAARTIAWRSCPHRLGTPRSLHCSAWPTRHQRPEVPTGNYAGEPGSRRAARPIPQASRRIGDSPARAD